MTLFVADLFLFCYERDFVLSPSDDNKSEVIEAFNSTSRYPDDLVNIDNTFFDTMVSHIYPSERQLNKLNISSTEASFLALHLSISDGFVKTKFFDKRDDFDFDTVIFHFWMVMFLVRHPKVFLFLNLFVLLECPAMSMTLIHGTKFNSKTSQTRI